MLEPITVANEACALATASPVQSLEAAAPTAAQVKLAYDRVLGFCLGLHRFSFSLSTRQLSRLVEPPSTGWKYAFTLPADRIGAPIALTDDATDPRRYCVDFLLEGAEVHADAEALWARIRIIPHPRLWSGTFRQAFTMGLAADLALTVKRDKTLRQQLASEAYGDPRLNGRGGMLLAAILDDSQSTASLANPAAERDPLTGAWSC